MEKLSYLGDYIKLIATKGKFDKKDEKWEEK